MNRILPDQVERGKKGRNMFFATPHEGEHWEMPDVLSEITIFTI